MFLGSSENALFEMSCTDSRSLLNFSAPQDVFSWGGWVEWAAQNGLSIPPHPTTPQKIHTHRPKKETGSSILLHAYCIRLANQFGTPSLLPKNSKKKQFQKYEISTFLPKFWVWAIQ